MSEQLMENITPLVNERGGEVEGENILFTEFAEVDGERFSIQGIVSATELAELVTESFSFDEPLADTMEFVIRPALTYRITKL